MKRLSILLPLLFFCTVGVCSNTIQEIVNEGPAHPGWGVFQGNLNLRGEWNPNQKYYWNPAVRVPVVSYKNTLWRADYLITKGIPPTETNSNWKVLVSPNSRKGESLSQLYTQYLIDLNKSQNYFKSIPSLTPTKVTMGKTVAPVPLVLTQASSSLDDFIQFPTSYGIESGDNTLSTKMTLTTESIISSDIDTTLFLEVMGKESIVSKTIDLQANTLF